MIISVIGAVLFFIPFLLLYLFSDKKRGFVYVVYSLLLANTFLAIFSQFFGIFYYNFVISAVILINLAVLAYLFFKVRRNGKKLSFNFSNIDWVLIIVLFLAFSMLYQVHFNYTGKMSLATDTAVSYHQVKNMQYQYPYFSDEWYAVSLAQGAINSHSLPFKNILNNAFFADLEMFFHSFVAEIMLCFGLNPLTQYTLFSLFMNVLIIILVYLLLRLNKLSKLTSAIASLSALYITSGANLPGMWQFIPFNMGIIFSLIGFCFISTDDFPSSIISFFMGFLFYPPLFPFFALAAVFSFFNNHLKLEKQTALKIAQFAVFLFIAVPVIFILLMISPLSSALSYVLSRIFFTSLTAPFMPQIAVYDIIPIPIILLFIFGIIPVFTCAPRGKHKKWLFFQLILGIVFWIFYLGTTFRFMIDYERIAIFTSIIIVIISGFGLDFTVNYINSKLKNMKFPVTKSIKAGIIVLFLILTPFYTQGENWKKLISIDAGRGLTAYPRSPANNYLTSDDLRIFKDIKNKKFLSVPWKGTTIGVATGNYPVLVKQGTISMGNENTLDDFLKADCKGKNKLAKKLKLDYVYIYKFDCPRFSKIDESAEGFVLYKVN